MAIDQEQFLLAVDTCSGQGSIALARGGDGRYTLLGRVELAAEWTSTALHAEIATLLERHQLTTADLAAYAVTNGPGSFTAIRVGAAAVKGLAEVHGKPVVAVSTLALIAQAAEWSTPPQELPERVIWVPILDARRAQVFGGLYQREGETLRALEPETVSALRVLLERCRLLADIPRRFCSPELTTWAEEIKAAEFPLSSLVKTPALLADTLARMGLEALSRGEGVSPLQVDANYIRASDAELFWKG